jgi:hypothetical protein
MHNAAAKAESIFFMLLILISEFRWFGIGGQAGDDGRSDQQ